MRRLFNFLYRLRIFGLFLLLEGIAVWLLFTNSNRYNTYYLQSANAVTGTVQQTTQNINDYFNLRKINEEVARENAELRELLTYRNVYYPDSTATTDSTDLSIYSGRVVNSTFRFKKNYLTLAIDPNDHIEPGMGVIGMDGVVGRVKAVSRNFATVNSLLHPDVQVSGRILSSGTICTIQWDGGDPRFAELKYVARHQELNVGDTVVTAGFGAVYPADVPIGTVSQAELVPEAPFYQARLKLSVDFTSIYSVFIVRIKSRVEKDSLEQDLDYEQE